ncbi:hypothetical protein [Paenibacillus solani]|uniref:Pilus assembly protein PilO n=1 Tax=Paenibacillus solani TaxID=1705565 RepID=A0A0M1NZY7_9BACL|nr:hypothetical protein [Paenibacillus solani]KOR87707.1 hypothetical protein AM231_00175 [Paenibacillus solani]
MNSKPLRIAFLSLLAIIIISGLFLFYFKGISPIQKQVDQLKTKIDSDKLVLTSLQESIKQQELHKVDALKLQHLVPFDDFVDQLLLDLKAQETLSKSVISNIGLSYSETNLSTVLLQMPRASGSEADNSSEIVTDGNVATDPKISSVTLGMTLQSPTYEDTLKFINGIESLDRIVKVDSLQLTDAKDEYNLSLTVYYAPQFKGLDLKELLPKPIFPGPSGKKNPFNVRVPTIPTEQ